MRHKDSDYVRPTKIVPHYLDGGGHLFRDEFMDVLSTLHAATASVSVGHLHSPVARAQAQTRVAFVHHNAETRPCLQNSLLLQVGVLAGLGDVMNVW